jgi:hypothetical protein
VQYFASSRVDVLLTGGAPSNRDEPHRFTQRLTRSTRYLRSSGSISTILRLDAIRAGMYRRLRYCARIEMHCSAAGRGGAGRGGAGRRVGSPHCSAGKRISRSPDRNRLNRIRFPALRCSHDLFRRSCTTSLPRLPDALIPYADEHTGHPFCHS